VYYNGGCAYVNVCDVSAEGSSQLSIRPLGWMRVWELNPGFGSLWLKASATLGGGGITSSESLHDRV
jgi:hypothetical protein